MGKIFEIINIPMGYVMRFLNKITGNQYVLALFLFAIFIEIILIPFAIKQQKNSIKQAKLRPKEMAIRKKYAGRDDNVTRQKLNEEIQALYQKEGYSPFGGCLPMLIQLPILLALYNIVCNPMKYICQLSSSTIDELSQAAGGIMGYSYGDISRNTIKLMDDVRNIIETQGIGVFQNVEGFIEKVPSADVLPQMNFLGLNLAGTPSFTNFNWLLVIPVLTFISYFFSMKLTRKFTYQPAANDAATGCSNKMMDYMMPLMSVYICFVVPAAVSVYWIFKSIVGIGKQFILHKAMPTPVFTEEDYKAAEKEYATKPEKNVKKSQGASGRAVRSLHHIDDEDFADTAPAAAERKARLEAEAAKEVAKDTDKKTIIAEAPLKDDKKSETKDNEEK